MIALLDQKQGQEERVTSYRFGDDERELTAGEKEAFPQYHYFLRRFPPVDKIACFNKI